MRTLASEGECGQPCSGIDALFAPLELRRWQMHDEKTHSVVLGHMIQKNAGEWAVPKLQEELKDPCDF